MSLPQTRRFRTNPTNPEAAGICERCGFMYSLADLVFQYEWTGATLTNLGKRVCVRCLDEPQQQNRPKFVPPDPVPVNQPRSPFWAEQQGFTPSIPVYQLFIPPSSPSVTPGQLDVVTNPGGDQVVTQGGLDIVTVQT